MSDDLPCEFVYTSGQSAENPDFLGINLVRVWGGEGVRVRVRVRVRFRVRFRVRVRVRVVPSNQS